MKPINMRLTGLRMIVDRTQGTLAKDVGNFPQKQTVTSEKLHSAKVTEHGRG